MEKQRTHEQGSVLIGVLILLSLALLITAGMLDSAATHSKTRALVNTQSNYYYQVEETMNRVVAWLQKNSKNLVTAFNKDHFKDNFWLAPTPVMGSNEGEFFGVPTVVKMASDHGKSVMLSNNSFFGQSSFPMSQNLDTHASFNPIASFQSTNFGKANARLLLVWARETNGDYEPIFRVDVVTGNNPDRGVHSYSYIYSHLVHAGVGSVGFSGFYGKNSVNFQTGNNNCFSYLYAYEAPGSWRQGSPRANCLVYGDSGITVSSTINGSVKTLLSRGITYEQKGRSTGTDCTGAGCHSYQLPDYNDWASHCPQSDVATSDLVVNADQTLEVGQAAHNSGCWRNVTVNGKVLTLKTANEVGGSLSDIKAYYFKDLNLVGNNAKIALENLESNKYVMIFTETMGNNHINGNQYYNPRNAPHQLVLNWLSTADVILDGTASFNVFIVAPKANVRTLGNFIFYGGIAAKTLVFSGDDRPNADETGIQIPAAPVLTDMNYTLKKASQRYR